MQNTKDGIVNVAVGAYAGFCNTGGSQNTAVGVQALLYNKTGQYNLAIGGIALAYTTGSCNVAVGTQAGFCIFCGCNNVVLGNNSGATIATSNNNIIISDGQGNIRTQFNCCGALSMDGSSYGTSGYVLTSQGNAARPTWTSVTVSQATPTALGTVYACTDTTCCSTALGWCALACNNNGTYGHVAIGSCAMPCSSAASWMTPDTAVGTWAMLNGGCGGNTAVGYLAYGNVDGQGVFNSVVGANSLGGAGGNAWNYNTVMGACSLSQGYSACYNTVVGYGVASYYGPTQYNTLIGSSIMCTFGCAFSSCYNTLVGALAMWAGCGNYNTTLGMYTLANVSGSYNLALGYNSGSAITTGNCNVILGGNTGSGIATSNNNIIISDGAGNNRIQVLSNGNVGIGTTNPSYNLQVNGSFAATTKSFVIDHPTRRGAQLRYASLEGPEHGVYHRGRITGSTRITLPHYWSALVDITSTTVQLTGIGQEQGLYVKSMSGNHIEIGSQTHWRLIDAYFVVHAERRDVPRLQVEI